MTVAFESPDQPDVIALIAALDAYQDSLYPADARYALDLGALCEPNVLFAVARDATGAARGCCALVLQPAYGEIKRMYVQPEARGLGLARRLIRALEHAAWARGCRLALLESGPYQAEALAFYAAEGYARRGAFGSYPEHPLSVFMGKALQGPSAG